MVKKLFCLALIGNLLIIGCAGTMPSKTQLQMREFQTRTYDTTDKKLIMKAVLNVLQDDGFVVKNANPDIGLLYAAKEEIHRNDPWSSVKKGVILIVSFGYAIFFPSWHHITDTKIEITEATVNISDFGKQTRVRVTFQASVNGPGGDVKSVNSIDEAYYQDFYSKTDKGVFIQKEEL